MVTYSCSSQKQPQDNIPADTPACIKEMISKFKGTLNNPYRDVYSYTYNGKIVYYISIPRGNVVCMDCWTDLYDSKCNLIAHPDGGMAGKGDGRAKDFFEKRTNEKLVWKLKE